MDPPCSLCRAIGSLVVYEREGSTVCTRCGCVNSEFLLRNPAPRAAVETGEEMQKAARADAELRQKERFKLDELAVGPKKKMVEEVPVEAEDEVDAAYLRMCLGERREDAERRHDETMKRLFPGKRPREETVHQLQRKVYRKYDPFATRIGDQRGLVEKLCGHLGVGGTVQVAAVRLVGEMERVAWNGKTFAPGRQSRALASVVLAARQKGASIVSNALDQAATRSGIKRAARRDYMDVAASHERYAAPDRTTLVGRLSSFMSSSTDRGVNAASHKDVRLGREIMQALEETSVMEGGNPTGFVGACLVVLEGANRARAAERDAKERGWTVRWLGPTQEPQEGWHGASTLSRRWVDPKRPADQDEVLYGVEEDTATAWIQPCPVSASLIKSATTVAQKHGVNPRAVEAAVKALAGQWSSVRRVAPEELKLPEWVSLVR